MARNSRQRILTALSGEYFVAAQLCARGIVASLTPKNYPGVDIFALNPETQKQTAIQVKTTRAPQKGYFVPGASEIDEAATPFVFVYIVHSYIPEFYIIKAQALAQLVREENAEDEKVRGVTVEGLKEFKDKWENLEIGI